MRLPADPVRPARTRAALTPWPPPPFDPGSARG